MDAERLTDLLSGGWLLAAGAYGLGLITGWFIWNAGKTAGEVGHSDTDDASEQAKETLDALAREIETAQGLLAKEIDENENLAKAVGSLDETVKRANGRLKLLRKFVDKSKKR